MKKILFYISFLLVILLLLSMDCSPENEKGRMSGGKRIKEYYIGDCSGFPSFVKKGDIFYIIMRNKILTYNIVNKKLDTIEIRNMGNIFGFTIYKDSFLFTSYNYDGSKIVITDDFENYKTYTINYPLDLGLPYKEPEDIKYIRDIAYSEKDDYFIYATYESFIKLIRMNYDLSNDQFIYNDFVTNTNSYSLVFSGICLYDHFVWMFSHLGGVEDYIFSVDILDLYTLKLSEKGIISNERSGSTSDYVKNFIPYDLWYEGDEFLYILSNGGEKGKLYIDKIKLDDKSLPL